MTAISYNTIDTLKSEGHYFAAGAVAHAIGKPRDSYGCHFGMRSQIENARNEFKAGWDAAKERN